MNTGTVRFFDPTRGFGFIQPDNGSTDIFVHISAVEQAGMASLDKGQKVGFDVIQDSRSGKSSAGNIVAA